MNLTVGPEPPAVYWRRRALVAGPVLVILLTFTACVVNSGSEGGQPSVLVARSSTPTASASASATPSPTLTPTTAPGEECTTENPCVPPVGSPPVVATLTPTQSAAPPGGTPAASTPAAPARPTQCANAELLLTALPGDGSSKVGEYPKFKLVITNASARPCTRDVGATQQELRVMAGTKRIWSSDDCSTSKGADPRLLQPGEKRTYYVVWNSKTSAVGCKPPSTLVGPGTYQLLARVGNLTSKPAAFTISR